MVFEMSRRLSRYKRGRRAVDLSASRFDGERQKTASPPARQPSLLFTAVPSDFFLFFFPPPPLYFPHRPSSSRPISSVQSLLLIRSTLSFVMEGTDGSDLFSLSHSFHDRNSSCCILFTKYRDTREPRYLLLLLLLLNKLENILDFEPKGKGYLLIHFLPQAYRRSRIAEST